MMPLVLANVGEPQIVKRIGGNPETKRHLEDLGFTVGGEVCIVSTLGGNVIVKVKESRVAVSDELGAQDHGLIMRRWTRTHALANQRLGKKKKI